MALESEAQRLSKRALARLISKSMKGDSEAFAEVYRIFINTIYFNVSSTLIDKSDTEDAVQLVVLSLHKGLPKLKSPYAFHSYLYRITVNVCNKYNKNEAKHQYSTLEEAEEEIFDQSSMTPQEELELKERDDLVRWFITKLPEKQRYTLVLYYYHDMSYKNIAEVLGTSVTVVGSNINRAKKNMKQMLEEHENRLKGTKESEDTFQGASLDSVFAAGIVSAVDTAIEPSAAEALWQRCLEVAPEIAIGTVVAKMKISAITAIIGGIMAAGIVVGVGVGAIQYINTVQPGPGSFSTTQQTWFIPERVFISFTSVDPSYPETHNPIFAELELSEGQPTEWLIKQGEIVLASGTGWTIEQSYFDDLPPGNYEVAWTIENDAGGSGTAHREFTIAAETSHS